jgi:hypothetical protein
MLVLPVEWVECWHAPGDLAAFCVRVNEPTNMSDNFYMLGETSGSIKIAGTNEDLPLYESIVKYT